MNLLVRDKQAITTTGNGLIKLRNGILTIYHSTFKAVSHIVVYKGPGMYTRTQKRIYNTKDFYRFQKIIF